MTAARPNLLVLLSLLPVLIASTAHCIARSSHQAAFISLVNDVSARADPPTRRSVATDSEGTPRYRLPLPGLQEEERLPTKPFDDRTHYQLEASNKKQGEGKRNIENHYQLETTIMNIEEGKMNIVNHSPVLAVRPRRLANKHSSPTDNSRQDITEPRQLASPVITSKEIIKTTSSITNKRNSRDNNEKSSTNTSTITINSTVTNTSTTTINSTIMITKSSTKSSADDFQHLVLDPGLHLPRTLFGAPEWGRRGCVCWETHDEVGRREVECSCRGRNVTEVPQDLWQGVNRLMLKDVGIEVLDAGGLKRYRDSLVSLVVDGAPKLKEVEEDALRDLPRLQVLEIHHAALLTHLPLRLLHPSLPQLTVLRLVNTGLQRGPQLLQPSASSTVFHSIDLENNKQLRELEGRSICAKADQLLLNYNYIEKVEALAFFGSEIGKLSLKGNRHLKELHPRAFDGIRSLRTLDLSETSITVLPTIGLVSVETLLLRRTYSLKTFPSVYSFKNIRRAELTYSYHCCAFQFPKLHDPDEFKRQQEEIRSHEEKYCKDQTAPSVVAVPTEGGERWGLRKRRGANGGRRETQDGVDRTVRGRHKMTQFDPGAEWNFSEGDFASFTTNRRKAPPSNNVNYSLPNRDYSKLHLPHRVGFASYVYDYLEPGGEGFVPSIESGSIDDTLYPGAGDFPLEDGNRISSVLLSKAMPASDTSMEGGGYNGHGDASSVFHRVSLVPSNFSGVKCGRLYKNYYDVQCLPLPDAFNPCEDVMNTLGLRLAVWVVVITAVFGNLAVMIVLMSTRFKMTVSKFLMCNLATADLCMGVYLMMIAVMDLHTRGRYFNYAMDWQTGVGCKVAGFLTVFGSELSIVTLVVITLERWYAITYAIHLNKRLRLHLAGRIMILAWLYALGMAALPLLGVSNYSKTSICLPMETANIYALTYLLTLLIANGVAFLLICVCYATMYWSITRNNINACKSDTTVAKRMALLVFTDFSCWAPIAFFGLTAVAGYPLINVTHAKFLLVFFYPLNSCANPYLYAILTKQYHRDLLTLLSRYGVCAKRITRAKASVTNPIVQHPLHLPKGHRVSSPTQLSDSLESGGVRYSPARFVGYKDSVRDKFCDDRPNRLQTVIEAKSPSQESSSGTDSPHPVKNCHAKGKFTPEQKAILQRYTSDRNRPRIHFSNTSPSPLSNETGNDGLAPPIVEVKNESLALKYLSITPSTSCSFLSPPMDQSV